MDQHSNNEFDILEKWLRKDRKIVFASMQVEKAFVKHTLRGNVC